jgi:L-seryl-tRNA(Ser) seleniumtransferase
MPANPLRNLPSVSDLLESPPLRHLLGRISHTTVVSRARLVLDEVLSEVHTAASDATLPSVTELAERIAHRLRDDDLPVDRPAINATGVILHPALRPPPSEAAIAVGMTAVRGGMSCVNAQGETTIPPTQTVAAVRLAQLTGAEAALVLHTYSAGRLLAFAALAAQREVVVARAHLCERGDGSRLDQAIELAGARLKEVGSVNAARPEDYRLAIGERAGLICYAPPTDYVLSGNVHQATLGEVVRVGRELRCRVLYDIARVALVDLPLPGCVQVADCLRSGADILVSSGDLLGGPRCGIVLGKREHLQQLERHPLCRDLVADQVTLALLAGTLALYQQPEGARREIPLLQLLDTPSENLKLRAHRLAEQMGAARAVANARAVESTTSLAGVSLPDEQLVTWCVELTSRLGTNEDLAQALRLGEPAVFGRVAAEGLLLDLRSVLPRQDQQLVRAVTAIAGETSGTPESK